MHNGLGPFEWGRMLVPRLSEPVDGLTDLALQGIKDPELQGKQ